MARLPKSIIEKYGITKKAWAVFRGQKKRGGKRGGVKSMARRRVRYVARRVRRRPGLTIPVAPIMGFTAAMYPIAELAINGDYKGAITEASLRFTGYDPYTGSFAAYKLKEGLLPILMGFLVHWVAGKIGINRALGRARIPVIRV